MDKEISTGKSDLSYKEKVALRIARAIATNLTQEHPEIASDYRNGSTALEIAMKYGLLEKHTASVSRAAIRMVLQNLLSKEELQEINTATLHPKRARAGQTDYQLRQKIFGLDEEARKKRAATMLATQIRDKIGLFGLSKEQKEEAYKNSALSNGFTPWTGNNDPETGLNELEYAVKLMNESAYIHQSGKLRKIPDFKKIASKINEIFHEGRSVRNASSVLRLRKKEGIRSRIPKHPGWTDYIHPTVQLNEKDYLLLIVQVPSFQKAGGHPDLNKITEHLNDVFHGGVDIRTKASVRRIIGRSKQ